MNQAYREAITKMEEAQVDPEYVLGWQGGFLGHPAREEQRVTDAYTAGFEDGAEKNSNNFDSWKK